MRMGRASDYPSLFSLCFKMEKGLAQEVVVVLSKERMRSWRMKRKGIKKEIGCGGIVLFFGWGSFWRIKGEGKVGGGQKSE